MVLEQIAGLINRNVAASTRARELCAQLEGRAFAIEISGPVPLKIFTSVENGAVRLSRQLERPADATVSGTPLALLSLVRPGAQTRLRASGATIGGDAEIAQRFYELMGAARPDVEEELSRVVGDVAAHQAGNFVRGITGWGRKAAQTTASNVAEYLTEESRDLIPRAEMDEFLAGVDELREAADRAAARVDILAKKGSA